jgi:signal transduction histidine kinase
MIRDIGHPFEEPVRRETWMTDADESASPATFEPVVNATLRDVARLRKLGAGHDVLAEAVAGGLAGLMPGAGAAVFSFVALPHAVTLIGTSGDPSPPSWQEWAAGHREFLVGCAQRPGVVRDVPGHASPAALGRAGHGTPDPIGVAVPIGDSQLWILALAPHADGASGDLREGLRCFGSALRSMFRPERNRPATEGVETVIRRAKQEWELVVDALPQIVCLLDSAGRVVRVNRAIEHWSLGSVVESPGKHFHDLLHPGCDDPGCKLLTGVSVSRQRMRTEARRAYEFRFRDPQLKRIIHVRVGRMREKSEGLHAMAVTSAALIVQDVTALESAKARLEEVNQQLESMVAERTRELADANRDLQNEITRCRAIEDQLRERTAELSQLSTNLINSQEQERKRIARELHDSIGQSLTALKYRLERAIVLERKGSGDGLPAEVERTVLALQEAADEVRRVALDLRPSVLDNLGASSAVAWFCRRFAASYPDLEVAFAGVTARDDEVPGRLETTIFRSLQELLNNVARHAKATRVDVSLRREKKEVILEVADDGVGLQRPLPHAAGAHGGHGTRNLKERAEMTGGRFKLRSGTPSGVVATLRWKLLPEELASPGPRRDRQDGA